MYLIILYADNEVYTHLISESSPCTVKKSKFCFQFWLVRIADTFFNKFPRKFQEICQILQALNDLVSINEESIGKAVVQRFSEGHINRVINSEILTELCFFENFCIHLVFG